MRRNHGLQSALLTLLSLVVVSPAKAEAKGEWTLFAYPGIGTGSGIIRVETPNRGSVGFALGSEVGALVTPPESDLQLKVRFGGTWARGVSLEAADLRIGGFVAFPWKNSSVQVGVDLFQNGVESRGFELPTSRGFEFPVRFMGGSENIKGFATIVPSFVGSVERHVERGLGSWGVLLGDELEWRVGARVHIPYVPTFTVTYSEREVVGGRIQRVGFDFANH